MKLLDNEKILFQSKNNRLVLTTLRLRETEKSYFGSKIKSIMLEELSACELRTVRSYQFLRYALLFFLLLNGGVYLLNQYLFKAELMKLFYGEVHIGPQSAGKIFYASLFIALVYLILFFFSMRKVFSFYATGMTINIHLRWLNFEERENFISQIEKARDDRMNPDYSR